MPTTKEAGNRILSPHKNNTAPDYLTPETPKACGGGLSPARPDDLNQSTVILRGLTLSDFGSVKVRTPCSIFAAIFAVSMAGSSSNTRR